MSSDSQQHSIEVQIRAAKEYAAKNGLTIINTFADEGVSGLTFNRPALQKLVAEVQSCDRQFDQILVFDISRWSRAEDADESAYYEFVCRSHGVEVCYISEQFSNDGTAMSTVMKAMKRAMAFEFSRELSLRVSLTKAKMLEQGYAGGGVPVYGFRRVSVDPIGKKRTVLKAFERKPRPTDRVIWVQGPESETNIIKWIFQKYADDELGISSIARVLNQKKIKPSPYAKKWFRGHIRNILRDERYTGTHVCYKSRQRLGAPIFATPEKWIRKHEFFPRVISSELFELVQQKLAKTAVQRRWILKLSKLELAAQLRKCHTKFGRLTAKIINRDPELPSTSVFKRTFGSLNAAYEFIDYHSADRPRYEMRVRYWPRILYTLRTTIIEKLSRQGTKPRCLPGKGKRIKVGDQFILGFSVFWHLEHQSEDSHNQWQANTVKRRATCDAVLFFHMNEVNTKVMHYYLIPSFMMPHDFIKLPSHWSIKLQSYKFNSLEEIIAKLLKLAKKPTNLFPLPNKNDAFSDKTRV